MATPRKRRSWGYSCLLCALLCGVAAWAALCGPRPAQAWIFGSDIPTTSYFNAFSTYHSGAYRDALSQFQENLKLGVKTSTSRWIDSICYHTMCGECYYQLGDYTSALNQYDQALRLYIVYNNWMIRVNFPPTLGAAGLHPVFPWGQSTRDSQIGKFTDTVQMTQGQLDQTQVLQQGGVMQNPVSFQIHGIEIVRATALALRRRGELLGPVSQYDQLTREVLGVLNKRPGQLHHWSEAWIEVQLGMALSAGGATAQAVGVLQHSLLAQGQFDHPLTGMALLELGKIAFDKGDLDSAATLLLEASYAAATFSDISTVEEALRYGAIIHLMGNRPGIYPPLLPAAAWAKKQGFAQLYVSLSGLAAENLLALDETARASSVLADTRNIIGRSDMGISRVGARINHVTAMAAYQAGNVKGGDTALAAALKFEQGGSLWSFHLAQADARFMAGDEDITPRVAGILYQLLLRDPTPTDWSADPLESLNSLVTPHPLPFEHWFLLAWKGSGGADLALEISDRIRRHRFFTSLPMGGRLLSLRWTLEDPMSLLDKQAQLEREELLARYPQYAKLAGEAHAIRDRLTQRPVVETDADARKTQSKELAALAELSQNQEIILREIAVRRSPATLLFPPLRKTHDFQGALPPGHSVLSFLTLSQASGGNTYAFMYGHDKYAQWQVNTPAMVQKQLGALLRDLGNFDQNHALTQTDIEKAVWRKSANRMRELLFQGSNIDLTAKFDELAIVPDGALWYLPFEALPAGPGEHAEPLITKIRIRYAPTVGLSIPYTEVRKPRPNIAVVVGKLFPKDGEGIAREAFDKLEGVAPGAVTWPSPSPAATPIYRTLFDQLVVYDEVRAEAGPFDWTLGPADRRKSGSALHDWMTLPWGGPAQIVLPGFHTPAETGLRKTDKAGADLFYALCGVMSTGTRTVLISRWRPGGQNSYDLMREFVQELPHLSAAGAWQRSVAIVSDTNLDPQFEPRFKHAGVDVDPPKATHPFFWSAFLLADTGSFALADDDRAAPPPVPAGGPAVLEFPKPPDANVPNDKPADPPPADAKKKEEPPEKEPVDKK